MNSSFIINGGIGRVISAIPALEKFAKWNPHDDFKVFVYGWESIFWSHPLLQQRTYSIGQKGIFHDYIKNTNLMIPEPYERYNYYSQKKSLAESFDEEINNTNDHSDLGKPNLYLQVSEINAVRSILKEQLDKQSKRNIVVIQPYGSGMIMQHNRPCDPSVRSLDVNDFLKIGKELSKDALVVYFGNKEFAHPADDFSFKPFDLNPDLRFYIALISQCDYFLGCDSSGQHIAHAFNKPGTVIMGSTFEKNVSYPNHFRIFRNGLEPVYNPIRISQVDSEFADRANDKLMTFTDLQITALINNVRQDLLKI